VVCGDEERWAPPTIEQLEGMQNGLTARSSESDSLANVSVDIKRPCTTKLTRIQGKAQSPPEQPEPKGLKKLFGSARLTRRKSRPALSDMDRTKSHDSATPKASQTALSSRPPQLPQLPGTAA